MLYTQRACRVCFFPPELHSIILTIRSVYCLGFIFGDGVKDHSGCLLSIYISSIRRRGFPVLHRLCSIYSHVCRVFDNGHSDPASWYSLWFWFAFSEYSAMWPCFMWVSLKGSELPVLLGFVDPCLVLNSFSMTTPGDLLKAIVVFFFTYSILDLVNMNSKCPSVQSLSCVRLLATPWIAAYQAPLSMDFPGKSTGVGCHEGCSFSFIEAFPGCANAFKLCEVLSSDFWFLCNDSKPWIPKELATIFAHPCPACFFFFSLGIS